LVDPGEASVEQIARALDFLVFNQIKRLAMEIEAHQRGFQMQWNNSAGALLQHIKFVREERELVTSRAEKFTREKTSIYQSNLTDFYAATSSPKDVLVHTSSTLSTVLAQNSLASPCLCNPFNVDLSGTSAWLTS